MQNYIIQTADEALRIVLSDDSLEKRVNKAIHQFGEVNSQFHLESMPDDVLDCFTELFEDDFKNSPLEYKAQSLRHLIEAIFAEHGAERERDARDSE